MRDRLRPLLRRSLYGLLSGAAVLLLTVLILMGTEGGTAFLLRTALDQASRDSTLRVETGTINGTLLGELAIEQLNVRDTASGLRVNAEYVGITFSVAALFNKHVHISLLEARGLAVSPPTTPAASDEPADPAALLQSLFELPMTLAADEIRLAPFTLNGPSPLTLQAITGSLALDSARAQVSARITRDNATWISPALTVLADQRVSAEATWQAPLGEFAGSGQLMVFGDLDTLAIEHVMLNPVVVTTTGTLETGFSSGAAPVFDLSHAATNINGAAFGMPDLTDFTGAITTAGTPERIALEAEAQVTMTPLGTTGLAVSAQYADAELRIRTAELDNPRFHLATEGTIALADALALSLSWRLADFTDGDLIAQVELVDVNGSGAVTVNTAGGQTVTELSLATLTGSLNGYPLTGSGEVSLLGGNVNDIALTLVSDVNSLLLNGSVTPVLNLDWALQAPALTQLMAGLTGEIDGAGTLTGTLDAPQVAGSLTASNVAYSDGSTQIRLAVLDAQASYRGTDNAVNLTFSNLDIALAGQTYVQTGGMAELTGSPADHAFSLSTRGPAYSLALSGTGQNAQTGWAGIFDSLQIASPFGEWVLQDALELKATSGAAAFNSHCWRMDTIRVCGEGEWLSDNGLTGNVAIDNLPLAWLNDNLPDAVPGTEAIVAQLAARPPGLVDLLRAFTIAMPDSAFVTGSLDLAVDFAGLGGDWAQTTLEAVLVPGDVTLGLIQIAETEAETNTVQVERYGIDDVDLSVERMAGAWDLQSRFGLYLSEANGLDFQGDFDGAFSLDDAQVLGGQFSLTFNNIAWLEALVPTLTVVRGEFGASGSISGTLERPLLNMDASLDNGSLRVPEYGLALTAIDLDFRSANSNEITIAGSARSGAGQIRLESLMTMPLLDSRTLHVKVQGEDFELLNTEETRMNVAPNIVLDFRNQQLDVSGSLNVPLLNIDFSEREALAAKGSVDVTRDVVIIEDDEVQREGAASELLGRIPVTVDVRLGMGDDVTFEGYGLSLAMTGGLELKQTIDRPMLAHGELNITEGSYTLYGQRLEIRNGRLLFLGNPLNPALDIRAVRETRVAEVGLLMNGTARNIQGQLFSTPSLPESEILSLLVTGNSFGDANAGQQSGENMLGAIALLGLEKGQGLTDSVISKLGIDTVALNNSGDTYRDSSLGLGKYLTPNLFMRYDIGLFDRENVLTLDYILTERLRLEVETGVSQSVDLTYTVEK